MKKRKKKEGESNPKYNQNQWASQFLSSFLRHNVDVFKMRLLSLTETEDPCILKTVAVILNDFARVISTFRCRYLSQIHSPDYWKWRLDVTNNVLGASRPPISSVCLFRSFFVCWPVCRAFYPSFFSVTLLFLSDLIIFVFYPVYPEVTFFWTHGWI